MTTTKRRKPEKCEECKGCSELRRHVAALDAALYDLRARLAPVIGGEGLP